MEHWKDSLVSNKPTVSICCSTYNHESFIKEALDGFVMQKTDFPFEIIINDDASTDGTQKILQEYAAKHSNIRLILQKKNQWKEGMLDGTFFGFEPFLHNILPIAKGKYIAFCEGDDYWTDPLKLQKQVDYLEDHPECVLCYHSYVILQNDKIIHRKTDKTGKYYTRKELIHTPSGIASSTKMFKNIYNENTKDEILKFRGDYLFTSYLGTYGCCGFVLDVKHSVYRLHKDGVWTGVPEPEKRDRVQVMYTDLYNLYLEIGNLEAAEIRKTFIQDKPFGIILPTYQRRDGKIPSLLKKALDSIFAQTYKNFKVYIIGDNYTPRGELSEIVSNYPSQSIYYENLSKAVEREKYLNNPLALWSAGGTFATNYGISKAEKDGIQYICFLDHDDVWMPNHLQLIHEAILTTNAQWICTKTAIGETGTYLPRIETDKPIIEYLPKPKKLIKSSVCFDIKAIPLRIRDVYAEGEDPYPGDADLWRRSAKLIKRNNFKSYYLNTHTCTYEPGCFEQGAYLNKVIIISRAIYNYMGEDRDIGILTEERLSLMQRYFINSLNNQTDMDFILYLIVGDHENDTTRRIESLDWGKINIQFIYTNGDLSEWKSSIMGSKNWGQEKHNGSPESIVRRVEHPQSNIMARLDTDDWVAPGWIAHIKYIAKTKPESHFLINYQIIGQAKDGRLYNFHASHTYARTSPFIALVQKTFPRISPYEESHLKMGSKFSTVYTIPPAYAFMVIHDGNRSNRIYGLDTYIGDSEGQISMNKFVPMIKEKRPKKPMDEQLVQRSDWRARIAKAEYVK